MAIPQSDPRDEVYAALVHRTIHEREIVGDSFYRVAETGREFELLEHGDEAVVDGVHWRITTKNEEKGCFFLFGAIDIPVGDIYIRCRPTDPIEELKIEFSKWETVFLREPREIEIDSMWLSMRSFFRQLVRKDQIVAYLDAQEEIKDWYRSSGFGDGVPQYEPTPEPEEPS